MNDREEGKGMRLLRKGKRGLIQAIFQSSGADCAAIFAAAGASAAVQRGSRVFAALLRRNDCVQRHYRHLSAQQRRRPDREADVAGVFQRCAGVRGAVLSIQVLQWC